MTDNDIERLWGRYAVPAWWADVLPRFRAIVEAAAKEGAEEEREACRKECRFVADQHIATELRNVALQCEAAIWARSAAGEQGRGGGE